MSETSIDSLAKRFGVARSYHGIDGRLHTVPDETIRAVLAAMNLDAGTDADAADTLAALRAKDQRRHLPCVIRMRKGDVPALPPARHRPGDGQGAGGRSPDRNVAWHIRLDCGGDLAGDARWDEGGGVLKGCDGLPVGCHTLALDMSGATAESVLIVAPQTAWQVSDAAGGRDRRLWGVSAPLYGLRSAARPDGGIGTYSDWGRLAETVAPMGADFIGVNPVHALFPADPARCSPYSPSSRLFHNIMHIAPDQVPQFCDCDAARDLWNEAGPQVERLRQASTIDYGAVAGRLYPVLNALYDAIGDGERAAIGRLLGAPDPALADHALFDALHEHFAVRLQSRASWRDWPQAYRRVSGKEVREFAEASADRVEFFAYLQGLANGQLADAAAAARRSGAALGLYADLAVGVARDGADVWARPQDYADGVSLGAPPDSFAPSGQNWQLAPFNPGAVRAAAYGPMRAMLQAVMRHAGLVRIDHILGFARSFWIPDGGLPGTYVAQRLDELLDIVAIESRHARCVVIGEDLGNVPDGLRDTLRDRGILGSRVAWFERGGDGHFHEPDHYPEAVCAALSSHDLPTLRGYWRGTDIVWQEKLRLIDTQAATAARAGRQADKARLLEFAGIDPGSAGEPGAEPPGQLAAVAYGKLAEAPAWLVSVQIEDMLGRSEQANLPGTTGGHPNWRRRLPVAVEAIAANAGAMAIAGAVNAHRGSGRRPGEDGEPDKAT